MRKMSLLFLFGFAIAYLPLIFIFSRLQNNIPQALAEDSNETLIVALETLAPEGKQDKILASADEEVTATPEPTKAPTPTPKPTETSTPTPTPIPTETPIPEPTATPDVWSPADLDGLFAQYAGQYGVDKNVLERIANCESHFNPSARNGDYLGMFQFSASTWQNYRTQLGLDANPDLRTNAEESIKTAAYVLQQRGTAPWPSCLR